MLNDTINLKVFKNLFGNNSKINASEIAVKDNNGKAKTLDNYLKENILYDNSDGELSTITLSDDAGNYDYLEIFFMNNNASCCNSVKIYNPNGKTVDLTTNESNSSGSVQIRNSQASISGTSISRIASGYFVVGSNGLISGKVTTNYIKIYRVVGYIY